MTSKIGGFVGGGNWKHAHGTAHYGRNFSIKWLKVHCICFYSFLQSTSWIALYVCSCHEFVKLKGDRNTDFMNVLFILGIFLFFPHCSYCRWLICCSFLCEDQIGILLVGGLRAYIFLVIYIISMSL